MRRKFPSQFPSLDHTVKMGERMTKGGEKFKVKGGNEEKMKEKKKKK